MKRLYIVLFLTVLVLFSYLPAFASQSSAGMNSSAAFVFGGVLFVSGLIGSRRFVKRR